MVSFASKAGHNVRNDIKVQQGGGAGFLRTFKDGKDCRVRFLQDPEEWLKFKEHYSQATKFFPCTQERDCPGCTSDDERMARTSRRYIGQALIVNEADAQDVGKVRAVKLPVDLANRLINKADRNGGTLLTRDYTIIRTGNGLDTEYDVEVEDKSAIDVSKFELVEVEPILTQMYEQAWGEATPAEKPATVENRKPKGARELLKAAATPGTADTEGDDAPPF